MSKRQEEKAISAASTQLSRVTFPGVVSFVHRKEKIPLETDFENEISRPCSGAFVCTAEEGSPFHCYRERLRLAVRDVQVRECYHALLI